MNKKTSLKDIAQRLGVSTALVSYVVNGKAKQARVSDAMAEKIRITAAEMNYLPNQLAKSLRSGRTHTIGLIVADISNPFFSALARIIEDEAARHGYVVMFGSNDENLSKSANLIDVFVNRQMDALIIVPAPGSEEQLKMLEKKGVPFVLIDRCPPGLNADAVVVNNEAAAASATQYLIDKGAKKIAMLAHNNPLPHMQRIAGYQKKLASAGIDTSLLRTVRFENMDADIDEAMKELAQLNIDALFFANNILAIEALKRLKKPAWNTIPLMATFDQSDIYDMLDHPPAYIRQPIAEMGIKAVELALAKINNPEKENELVVLDAVLVVK